MRGNPIAQLAVLILALAGAGMLVGVITRPVAEANRLPPANASDLPVTHSSEEADLVVDAYVEFELSAPARTIRLGAISSPARAFEIEPTGLTADAEFSLALRKGVPTDDRLMVEWEKRDQTNFLHLTIEPDSLKTRALTLHFPPGEESTILELGWPEKTSSP